MDISEHRLKIAMQSLIYLLVVFALLWETDGTTPRECTGFDAPPEALERSDYDFLIRHSGNVPATSRHVVIVVLDPAVEPEEVISDLCIQREFTSLLLDRLNQLGVSVIALDKTYRAKRCPEQDPGTKLLWASIQRSQATIIRGIEAEIVPETIVDGRKVCLRLRKGDNLSLPVPPERTGIVRLDPNTRLIPLNWPVRTVDDQTKQETTEEVRTLSFVTAEAVDSELVHTPLLSRAVRNNQQPYSTRTTIPPISALRILCGPEYSKISNWRQCHSTESLPQLRHAVIVFGDHIREADRHPDTHNPNGIYGVDLQANYIAAILDKRYYMPLLTSTANLVCIGIALLVLHLCFHFFKPLWRTLLFALIAWCVIVVASLIVLSFYGYLVTVWMHGITLTTIFVTALHHWDTTHD
jgi:CHASE2 domain